MAGADPGRCPAVGAIGLGESTWAGSRTMQDVTAAGLLGVLPWAVFCFLWWVGGHETLGADYAPSQPGHQLLFMQYFRSGYWPLWAPAESGGIPFATYILAQQYSPFTWLFMLFDAAYDGLLVEMLTFLRIALLGMSGFATYLLARRLNLGWTAGLLCGVAYVFNLRMLDSFRYGSGLDAVVWLPVLVLLIERMLAATFQTTRAPGRSAVRSGLAFVVFYAIVQHMTIVSGHVQMAFYCVAFAGTWFVVRTYSMAADAKLAPGTTRLRGWRQRIARALPCVGWMAAGTIAGLCLTSVMLLPIAAEMLPLWTNRTAAGAAYWYEHRMTWTDLLCNVLWPWLANVHSAFFSAQGVWLLAAVAAGGLLSARQRIEPAERRLIGFLLISLAFCIAYSLGSATPVAPIANRLVPGLTAFRGPGRCMIVGAFAAAILAGWMLDVVFRRGCWNRMSWRIIATGCTVQLIAGASLLAAWLTGAVRWGEIRNKQRTLYLPLLGDIADYAAVRIRGEAFMIPLMAAIIIVVAAALLALTWLWYRGRLTSRVTAAAFVLIVLVEAGVYQRFGTWTIPGRHYTAPSDKVPTSDIYHTRVFEPWRVFTFCGKDVVRPSSDGKVAVCFESPGPVRELLQRGGATGWRIYYQNVAGHEISRGYITPAARLVSGDDLATITTNNPYAACVIDTADPVNAGAEQLLQELGLVADTNRQPNHPDSRTKFQDLNESVRVVTFTPNRTSFDVQLDTPAVFNYSDAWMPGWRASVDGDEVPVWRANHAFKAVALPAGEHRLDFVYDSPSFRFALPLALVTLCVLSGIATAALVGIDRKRWIAALCVVGLCAPVARSAYDGIYAMVFRDGIINYDPAAEHPRVPDLDEYLHTPPADSS